MVLCHLPGAGEVKGDLWWHTVSSRPCWGTCSLSGRSAIQILALDEVCSVRRNISRLWLFGQQ